MRTHFTTMLLLVSFIITTILFANEAFSDYQKKQTSDTFLKAYKQLEKENQDVMNAYLLYMELNRFTQKIESNLDSLDMRSKFSYANLLLSLGRFDESIEVYEQINAQTPNWSCPWRHKGEAYLKNNELAKSEKSLKKAIETRVEHYDAYIMLAEVQMKMEKYQEALETFQTGLSYKGKDIEDPEEEVNQLDEKILHLKLLKYNNLMNEYNELLKTVQKKNPDEPILEQFK